MSTQNPNTPTTMHPTLNMTWKKAMRMERIARLSLDPSGFSVQQIANMVGVHYQTVVYIRQLPAYHAKMAELQSGVLSQFDKDLRTNIDNARQEMRDMLPLALNVIKAAAMGKYGSAIQYKAATDILDREGNLAKVSKTSVSLDVVPNMTVDPAVAGNLMALLNALPSQAEIGSAPENNTFTQNATQAADSQFELGELNTEKLLDKLDASMATKN